MELGEKNNKLEEKMADEELEKTTGDEGFVAPPTGGEINAETNQEKLESVNLRIDTEHIVGGEKVAGSERMPEDSVSLVGQINGVEVKITRTIIHGIKGDPFRYMAELNGKMIVNEPAQALFEKYKGYFPDLDKSAEDLADELLK